MSRDEEFTSHKKIVKDFPNNSKRIKSGVPILYENGEMYYDCSDSMVKVVGKTGYGKSQCFILPLLDRIIDSKESFIITDVKGECKRNTYLKAEKNGYRTIVLDFNDVYNSPDGWNPLKCIVKPYNGGSVQGKDFASSIISDFASCIQEESKDDPFWGNSSAEFIQGIIYSMLEFATSPEEINVKSLKRFMVQANNSNSAMFTPLKDFYDLLPEESKAKEFLSTYVKAPADTRNSIYAVASNSLKQFLISEGLVNMLCKDTIDIDSLDINDKPLGIFIILPSFTNSYDSLATVFVNQLMNHFMRLADIKYNGRLSSKLWLICEELGSVGSSIKNLDRYMTEGRSRNVRIVLVLQSDTSQLVDIYGESKAQTINSTVNITIGFSTNDWKTNLEWSERIGERTVFEHGVFHQEKVISPNQLSAMPKGAALIQIDGGRYKYIAKFPMYYETHQLEDFTIEDKKINCPEIKVFDLMKQIEVLKKKKEEQSIKLKETNDKLLTEIYDSLF